jgi:hypothetical protein
VPANPDDNPCFPLPETQVGGKWDKWATVGELHAYWNASGTFTYGRGGSTSIGAVFSLDGGADWSVGGSFSYSDTSGSVWSDQASVGDHDARLVQLHLFFKKVKTGYTCIHGGTRSALLIREAGVDNPAMSTGPLRKGSSQLGGDGPGPFHAAPNAFKNKIPRGATFCIQGSHSRSYSAGAVLAGLSVQTTTTYNATTQQCVKAGLSRARAHWEWGQGGKFTSPKAKVLHSY